MSEEPRRSGRATKGQHTKASASPAPTPKPSKPVTKAKSKKSAKAEAADDDSGEDDTIRCICGNDDPNDKRAFIGCEACLVWQHNVCMGEPEDEEDVPDHYFCEQCRPEEHKETLAALAKGEKIWEARGQQWKQWKKMSAQRRKSKSKGEESKPTWLKKTGEEAAAPPSSSPESPETGTKRKRDSVKPDPDAQSEPQPEQPLQQEDEEAQPVSEAKPVQQTRPDKRRKSSQAPGKVATDANTAFVEIDKLPTDRRKIAEALSKIIADDVQARAKSGFRIPDGHTAKSLGVRYGGLIEYACFMNYGEPKEEKYKQQFRTLSANLKRNKLLVARLLNGSLTADELSLMESKDMLSEEKQREQAKLKEELDRQAVAVQEEGPVYRQTHKGFEMVEDERHRATEYASNPAPVRERTSVAEEGGAGSPTTDGPRKAGSPVQARRPSFPTKERRSSSQQNFDINAVWNKTAHSPTTSTAQPLRPMQMPPRRRSSVPAQQNEGAKEDPDVDRMLQDDDNDDDDDDDYTPAEDVGDDTIVWRGKLVHEAVGEPIVNARFVAGRDLTSTVAWRDLLPPSLNIDGRLQIAKAEEYVCGLQWSHSSDVSVLALTPYDDAATFNKVFDYFNSRGRYAVINKAKSPMVKDLYVIPVEARASLPEHVQMLEHCTIKSPVEERMMLATFVIARAPGKPEVAQTPGQSSQQSAAPTNGNGQHTLPQHMRPDGQGPSGSPLHGQGPTFSPPSQSTPGHVAPPVQSTQQPVTLSQPPPFTPNAYSPQPHLSATPDHQPPAYPISVPSQGPVPQHAHSSAPPLPVSQIVAEILGPFAYCPTAQQVVQAQPGIEREKLENLRKIFEEDEAARTNIAALAAKLDVRY